MILFPKLEKLTLGRSGLNFYDASVRSAFSTIFGQGICQMPKLTQLEIFSTDGYLDDLLGINLLILDPIRWQSLKSLQLEFNRSLYNDDISKFIDGLMFLARSGMALEELSLAFELKGEVSHQVSGNLSQFLQSQSISLEKLTLNLKIYAREHNFEDLDLELLPRITLPHCPCLKILDISAMYYRHMEASPEYLELFSLISLPSNFPILERLSLSCPCVTTMALLRKSVNPDDKIHLKVFEYDSTNWEDMAWSEEDNVHLLNNFLSVGEIKINN